MWFALPLLAVCIVGPKPSTLHDCSAGCIQSLKNAARCWPYEGAGVAQITSPPRISGPDVSGHWRANASTMAQTVLHRRTVENTKRILARTSRRRCISVFLDVSACEMFATHPRGRNAIPFRLGRMGPVGKKFYFTALSCGVLDGSSSPRSGHVRV